MLQQQRQPLVDVVVVAVVVAVAVAVVVVVVILLALSLKHILCLLFCRFPSCRAAKMWVELQMTRHAFIRMCVWHGQHLGTDNNDVRARVAGETFDHVFWLCFRFDPRRCVEVEGEEALTFYLTF